MRPTVQNQTMQRLHDLKLSISASLEFSGSNENIYLHKCPKRLSNSCLSSENRSPPLQGASRLIKWQALLMLFVSPRRPDPPEIVERIS